MNYHDARERYRHDPVYHHVVNAMFQLMLDLHLTPGEVRDAAALAAIKFEQERHRMDLFDRQHGGEAGK